MTAQSPDAQPVVALSANVSSANTLSTITQAVILCGGFGTRMGDLVKDVPKPMLSIAGVPLLQRTVDALSRAGVTDIILLAHYLADVIERHFADYCNRGSDGDATSIVDVPALHNPRVRIIVEHEPLGTAGAIRLATEYLNDAFLVLYGDEFIDFDIGGLIADHVRHRPVCTMLARPSHHPWDGHLIQSDDTGRITGFVRRFDPAAGHKNLGNLGIYVCERGIVDFLPPGKCGFVEDLLPALLVAGEAVRVRVMESAGYVKDVGTSARITEVEEYLRHKTDIARAHVQSQSRPSSITTVFLDRDGVIIEDRGLVRSLDDVSLLPGAAVAIATLNRRGVRVIVVTNQPQVARGLVTEDMLHKIHDRMRELLAVHGASIDEIYHCPHHPETHHNEGVPELRRGCDCRKPLPGMILRAKDEFDLDLASCVMIGDSDVDIEAGKNAGVRTVLVGTMGRRRSDGPTPNLTAPSLFDAVVLLFPDA